MSPSDEFCNFYISPIFVTVISGLMALAGALLNQLFHQWGEKKRHERDVELRLVESGIRKQESIQAIQLQSLKELVTIYQDMLPNIWPSPDFESDDAYVEILHSMPVLMKQLNDYLKSSGYILPNKVADKINMTLYQCNQGHWGVSTSETPAYEPNKCEVKLAKGTLQSLTDSITIFKGCLGITAQDDDLK